MVYVSGYPNPDPLYEALAYLILSCIWTNLWLLYLDLDYNWTWMRDIAFVSYQTKKCVQWSRFRLDSSPLPSQSSRVQVFLCPAHPESQI